MAKSSGLGVQFLVVGCALLLACMSWSAQSTASSPATKKAAKESSSSKPSVIQTGGTSKSSSAQAKTSSAKGKHARQKTAKGWRRRGQQKIDSTRAEEIQQALIREHYLTGEPTGTWDQASQRAMERYQADNGWQTKTIPDSRALIKLGLGPNHDHLLNPGSAMTGPLDKPAEVRPSHGPNAPADPANPLNQP